MKWLRTMIFASIGGLTRYFLECVPYHPLFITLLINVVGTFCVGVIHSAHRSGWISERLQFDLTVGFLGAFTTFATFIFQLVELLPHNPFGAICYTLFSLGGALTGYLLGCLTWQLPKMRHAGRVQSTQVRNLQDL